MPTGARRARALSSPREVTEGIIKVKNLPMKLAGMLQGAASRSISAVAAIVPRDIVVRIKADAPVG